MGLSPSGGRLRLDQVAQLVIGQHAKISAPVPNGGQPPVAEVEYHADPTCSADAGMAGR